MLNKDKNSEPDNLVSEIDKVINRNQSRLSTENLYKVSWSMTKLEGTFRT